jgi:hypothetical protein
VTIARILGGIVRHPMRFLATRWNWKAAALSALMRGAIFFGATLNLGLATASRALVVDAAFRIPLAGACAAVIQEVRWAEPRWSGVATAVLAVPMAAHAIEIAAHSIAGTPLLWRGVTVSVGLSILSSTVELFVMRHDVLLVGPGAGSVASDVRRLLRLARSGPA